MRTLIALGISAQFSTSPASSGGTLGIVAPPVGVGTTTGTSVSCVCRNSWLRWALRPAGSGLQIRDAAVRIRPAPLIVFATICTPSVQIVAFRAGFPRSTCAISTGLTRVLGCQSCQLAATVASEVRTKNGFPASRRAGHANRANTRLTQRSFFPSDPDHRRKARPSRELGRCATERRAHALPTILTPCRVPWLISSSTSGVTLIHSESDTEPECLVILGGGRLTPDGRTDSRRIDITFKMCYHARLGPHADSDTIESVGYTIDANYDGNINDYLQWLRHTWTETGLCPASGFYVATKSDWLITLPSFFQQNYRHYVVEGRDGYVELIAGRFAWQEWIWSKGHRDDAPSSGPVVGSGEGVA